MRYTEGAKVIVIIYAHGHYYELLEVPGGYTWRTPCNASTQTHDTIVATYRAARTDAKARQGVRS